jgi:hypothetical protein
LGLIVVIDDVEELHTAGGITATDQQVDVGICRWSSTSVMLHW